MKFNVGGSIDWIILPGDIKIPRLFFTGQLVVCPLSLPWYMITAVIFTQWSSGRISFAKSTPGVEGVN
jgi:hypothetical protein